MKLNYKFMAMLLDYTRGSIYGLYVGLQRYRITS
jgi:hypothetical protein